MMGGDSDILSDVLQGVRLTGAIYFDMRACAPWATAAAAGLLIAPRLLPGVQHAISYHVVAEGRCWASMDGMAPVLLSAGDIIVFPHGDAHVLSSSPELTAQPDLAAYDKFARGFLPLTVDVANSRTSCVGRRVVGHRRRWQIAEPLRMTLLADGGGRAPEVEFRGVFG